MPLLEQYGAHCISDRIRYVRIFRNGKWEMLHRVLAGVADGYEIDHIDHDPLNNRRSNLRPATVAQNRMNTRRRKDRTHTWRGVHRSRGKWHVAVGGRHVGVYRDEAEAARAYDKVALERYGEFAVLNFPM